MTAPFDARCENCDEVHVIRVGENQSAGDTLAGYPHRDTAGSCGEVAEHTLIARLSGIENGTA